MVENRQFTRCRPSHRSRAPVAPLSEALRGGAWHDKRVHGGQSHGHGLVGSGWKIGWEEEELVIIELMVVHEVNDGHRSLLREWEKRCLGEGPGGEGVGAMVEHFLGKVGPEDVGLDAQIAEHGIRFPSAKELDDILVNVRTEERCGPSGTEATGGERLEVYISKGSKASGGVAKSIGDIIGFDVGQFVG